MMRATSNQQSDYIIDKTFKYNDAYETRVRGRSGSETCVLIVPGLTDGPGSLAYANDGGALVERVSDDAKNGNSLLATFELSTSFERYGTKMLDDDAREIGEVMRKISEAIPGVKEFTIVGHSTGCQSACRFLETASEDDARMVSRIVLQAGVSDRDWYDADNGKEMMRSWVARAEAMEPEEMMPSDTPGTYGVPTNARRFLALAKPGGDDDWFSLDLFDGTTTPATESKITTALSGKCSHVDVRIVVSTADEYVPYSAEVVVKHNERVRAAFAGVAKSAETLYVNGNHDLSEVDEKDLKKFVDFVLT